MTQNNSHFNSPYNTPPRTFNLSLIQKLVTTYKLWYEVLLNFPKVSRYTLGQKIDNTFLEAIEQVIKAEYASKAEKQIFLSTASVKLDLLKFFLQISWEVKSLDNKKYITLSEKLNEVGKMLGGWIKSIK